MNDTAVVVAHVAIFVCVWCWCVGKGKKPKGPRDGEEAEEPERYERAGTSRQPQTVADTSGVERQILITPEPRRQLGLNDSVDSDRHNLVGNTDSLGRYDSLPKRLTGQYGSDEDHFNTSGKLIDFSTSTPLPPHDSEIQQQIDSAMNTSLGSGSFGFTRFAHERIQTEGVMNENRKGPDEGTNGDWTPPEFPTRLAQSEPSGLDINVISQITQSLTKMTSEYDNLPAVAKGIKSGRSHRRFDF